MLIGLIAGGVTAFNYSSGQLQDARIIVTLGFAFVGMVVGFFLAAIIEYIWYIVNPGIQFHPKNVSSKKRK